MMPGDLKKAFAECLRSGHDISDALEAISWALSDNADQLMTDHYDNTAHSVTTIRRCVDNAFRTARRLGY